MYVNIRIPLHSYNIRWPDDHWRRRLLTLHTLKGQDARTIDMIDIPGPIDHGVHAACKLRIRWLRSCNTSNGISVFFGSWHPKKQKVRDLSFFAPHCIRIPRNCS